MSWPEAFMIVGVMAGFACCVWAAAWASSKADAPPPLEPYEPKWPWTWFETAVCKGCGELMGRENPWRWRPGVNDGPYHPDCMEEANG